MYSADDMRTPRDRIHEEYIRRLLQEEAASPRQQARKEEMKPSMPVTRESLAMVYSPVQHWREIYPLDTALSRGTLFRELDKPWGVENRKGGFCCGK